MFCDNFNIFNPKNCLIHMYSIVQVMFLHCYNIQYVPCGCVYVHACRT
jgi:hypothetical protein